MPHLNHEHIAELAAISPVLLPKEVQTLLLELGEFVADPLTEEEVFEVKVDPHREKEQNQALLKIDTLTHRLTILCIKKIKDLTNKLIVCASDCRLGSMLYQARQYLLQNPIDFNLKYDVNTPQIKLARWLAQLQRSDRDNWIPLLKRGLDQDLRGVDLNAAILVNEQRLVTWPQIYKATRDVFDANPGAETLRVAYDSNKENPDRFLNSADLNTLANKIPSAKICLDLLQNTNKTKVQIITNKDFLQHVHAIILQSSISGEDPLETEAGDQKDNEASPAASIATLWISKWLDYLKALVPTHYEMLQNNETFQGVLRGLKIAGHLSEAIDNDEPTSTNCTNGIQVVFANIFDATKTDALSEGFLNSDFLSSHPEEQQEMLRLMYESQEYMLNTQLIRQADEQFSNFQTESENSDFNKLLLITVLNDYFFGMALFLDVMEYFSSDTQDAINEHYQRLIIQNVSAEIFNLLLIEWLGAHLRQFEKFKKLNSLRAALQRLSLPQLGVNLLTKNTDNNAYALSEKINLAARYLEVINAEIKDIEGYILELLKSTPESRPFYMSGHTIDEMIEASANIILLQGEGRMSQDTLKTLVNHQKEKYCQWFLEKYYYHFYKVDQAENINHVARLKMDVICGQLIPYANLLAQYFVPAIKSANNLSSVEQKDFNQYLHKKLFELCFQAQESGILKTTEFKGVCTHIQIAAYLRKLSTLPTVSFILGGDDALSQLTFVIDQAGSEDDPDCTMLNVMATNYLPLPLKLSQLPLEPTIHPATVLMLTKIKLNLNDNKNNKTYYDTVNAAVTKFIFSLSPFNVQGLPSEVVFSKLIYGMYPSLPDIAVLTVPFNTMATALELKCLQNVKEDYEYYNKLPEFLIVLNKKIDELQQHIQSPVYTIVEQQGVFSLSQLSLAEETALSLKNVVVQLEVSLREERVEGIKDLYQKSSEFFNMNSRAEKLLHEALKDLQSHKCVEFQHELQLQQLLTPIAILIRDLRNAKTINDQDFKIAVIKKHAIDAQNYINTYYVNPTKQQILRNIK